MTKDNIIIGWYGIEPQIDMQRQFMLDSSQLFEIYRDQESIMEA